MSKQMSTKLSILFLITLLFSHQESRANYTSQQTQETTHPSTVNEKSINTAIPQEHFIGLSRTSVEFASFLDLIHRNYHGAFLDENETYAVTINNKIGIYTPLRSNLAHGFIGQWYNIDTSNSVGYVFAIISPAQDGRIFSYIETNDTKSTSTILTEDNQSYNSFNINTYQKQKGTQSVSPFRSCCTRCMDTAGIPPWFIQLLMDNCNDVCSASLDIASCTGCMMLLAGAYTANFGAALSCAAWCKLTT
jgi:hypothetical protein